MNGQVHMENHPTPREGKRVYFLCSLGFPIHPFLRRLLEFYGLQLHHLTANPILHITGSVALYEIHLGCEAHFKLWRKYFCIVPCSADERLSEVGAVEVCRIEGTDYPSETPRDDTKVCPSECFNIEDVPLLDPVWPRLPRSLQSPQHYKKSTLP